MAFGPGRASAVIALAGCALLWGSFPAFSQARPKTTIGRVERVWIGDAALVLPAKIDTGARTTALGVESVETFRRRGQDWVRFSFPGPQGEPVTLERKVLRFAALKKKNAPGLEQRPVILMKLCVADIYQLTQVNLVDRRQFNYPVLIGRRFLFGKAVVDTARQYTSEPRCGEMKGL